MDSQLLDSPAAQAMDPGTDMSVSGDAYRATASSLEALSQLPIYDRIREAFREGTGKMELRKRYMLKMIDEAWVSAIEDTLPALDTIIRNPGMLLKEVEKVVPIEQSRRVTSRSIAHLVQNTNYINEIREDGSVMPSKLLNVFQDETILTYENKFINTLLTRLYGFVTRRYEAAEACGEDEKTTKLAFEQSFAQDERTAKIHLTIEVSEKPRENEVVRNYIYTSDLWKRVERINRVLLTYMDSDFVRQMQRSYIRPPVMRTNKLLKNVDFRQCLTLWEFLDEYDNTGYETLIQENLENVDEACIRDIYNTIAVQYVVFQKHIQNDFIDDHTLDSQMTSEPLRPKIRQELEPLRTEEFDVHERISTEKPAEDADTENVIEEALRVALAADAIYAAEEADSEQESVFAAEGNILRRYRYSFLSRLILAQDPTQTFYTRIKNKLLSYQNVKSRICWNHETFLAGRKKIARVDVKGKTLFLYLRLDPKAYTGSKYHPVDVSDNESNRELPFLFQIRSDLGVKYAEELILAVMAKLAITPATDYIPVDYHIASATVEELARQNPPLVRILSDSKEAVSLLPQKDTAARVLDLPKMDASIDYQYRYSFTARLVQAQEPLQTYYEQIKNYLLSYNHVKCNMTWGCESFILGRKCIARLRGGGKTLILQLAVDPATCAKSKYRVEALPNSAARKVLPTQFRIKGARGVKIAMELIDMTMAAQNAVQGEIPRENYHLPPMTIEEMLASEKPMVKPTGNAGVGDL